MRNFLASAGIFIALLLASPSFADTGTAPEWIARQYDSVISEEWMNVIFSEQKIGFSYSKIEKGKTGFRITGRAVIRLSVMGATQDLSFSRTYHLDAEKNVVGFISLMTMQGQRQQTVGTMRDGIIELSIKGAGGVTNVKRPVKPGVKFADIIGFTLADKLKPGLKMEVPIYLVELRANDVITIEVLEKRTIPVAGKQQDVFVVDISLKGFKSRSFITPEGVTVREEQNMMGMVHEITTAEDALKFDEKATIPVSSLITFSLVKPDKKIDDPESLTSLELLIGGVNNPKSIPQDKRQTISGKLTLGKTTEGAKKFFIPLTIKKQTPPKTASLDENVSEVDKKFLTATPEIQSEHKMIKREASRITEGAKSSWEMATKINQWVFANIEKKLVDSITALDVLLAKQGECQSHTNLFTALARSVGLPVKTVAGIVYSKENEGFLYHAWPEVYSGGEWIAMDPTLGQNIADATHIKLGEGGLEGQLALVRFIGKISISIKNAR